MNCLAVVLLLVPSLAFSQKNRLFTSIEEAKTVPVDSVFRLDLGKERYEALPEELYQFKQLEELYLEKNKLDSLPEQFSFPNLRILDLSKNKFEIFPEAICQNTKLNQLYMGKNKMSALPECISELQQLTDLDVWFNTITVLPESMTTMRRLRNFDLRGMNYSTEFQDEWKKKLPWVKFEFDLGCDCGH